MLRVYKQLIKPLNRTSQIMSDGNKLGGGDHCEGCARFPNSLRCRLQTPYWHSDLVSDILSERAYVANAGRKPENDR